ncbi:MAG: FAD-dependent thymidylate synthase [Synergistaceae bacterium]|nr:FAD-dependent thymidylate synthase [Synergistaceae bacterium]
MSVFVKLIAATPEADRVVAAAAKICYSPSGAAEIFDGLDTAKTASFLKMLRESGHLSPFEHASFTFAAEGLSRVATHQLVRHRMASYSQQSQRYVGMIGNECIVPPTVKSDPRAFALFREQTESAQRTYDELVALGIPKEDARFILPHGAETRIVLTMNARELHHFFALRLCRRAQWEIRELAREMLRAVRAAAPVLFAAAGPSCVAEGSCHEAHSCGQPYKNMEDMLSQ